MPAEKTPLRRFLDTVLGRRLSVVVPAFLALTMYLLFVLFGQSAEKTQLLVSAPLVSAIGFLGAFFVFGFQTRRTKDAAFVARFARLLDLFTLFALIVFGWGGIVQTVQFLLNRNVFNPGTTLLPLLFSAIALAHQRRKD